MIYIDIDGTLADTDKFLFEKCPRAEADTHLLFKTFFNYADEVYMNSEPLIDFTPLYDCDFEFKLLTKLPSKQHLSSFTDNVSELYEKFIANKKHWCEQYFPGVDLIIVPGGYSKSKYCTSASDILIDDNKNNGVGWEKAGGIWFKSVADFFKNYNHMDLSQQIKEVSLW